jgi:anti-anti-sigma regulatory factor
VGTPLGLLTYTPIFAHFGHWYVSLPTFLGPVVIIAVIVKLSERRTQRQAQEGDKSPLRVVVTKDEDRSILTVSGALDYPVLLDIEHELAEAARHAPQVLLDLRKLTTVEEELAWNLIEVIGSVEDAEVAVLLGSAPSLHELRRICTLEAVKLIDDTAVAGGTPSGDVHGP